MSLKKNFDVETKTETHHFTSKELQRINEGLPPWESMSFACGGWLQFYMFGVAKALQECNLDKGVKYYGCSAGALTAVGLALGGEFDDAIKFCKDYCLPTAYSDITGLFKLAEYVTMCTELTVFPVYKKLPPNTLNVAVTRLPFLGAERISSFNSKEDLMHALLASSAAFPLAPLVKMKGGWYIDGGLSDFQPVENDDTVTVSPFYFSECDIKPSRYIPLWWTFLPPRCEDTVDWLYNLGFVDCVNYLKSRGIPVKREVLNQEERVKHPYNERKKVSIHRLLGYDVGSLTHEYVSFVLDLILLVLLIFVLKPLVLGLIYLELFIRIAVLTTLSVSHSLLEIYPPFLIRKLILRPYLNVMSCFTGGMFPQKQFSSHFDPRRRKMLRDLWECTTCVGSLSLLMRFISGPPSTVELIKHKKLAKYSLCYRIFHHMI